MELTPKIGQSSAEKVLHLYARPDVRAAVDKIRINGLSQRRKGMHDKCLDMYVEKK